MLSVLYRASQGLTLGLTLSLTEECALVLQYKVTLKIVLAGPILFGIFTVYAMMITVDWSQ